MTVRVVSAFVGAVVAALLSAPDAAPAAQKSQAGPPRIGGEIKAVRLSQHPNRQQIVQKAVQKFQGNQIKLSLLPGKTYMATTCLGIRASAGNFLARPGNPKFEFRNTGLWIQFSVDKVSIDALTIRMRPNPTNLQKPCSFGKRVSIGGSASDLRLELTLDPVLNIQQCKVGNPGATRVKWRIGGLNLKPLQNDLDKVAKNMIEDTLTYGSNVNYVNQMVRNIDDALEADCPG